MAARTLRKRRLSIAIVLPPREGFSPDAVGAIGLLVHRLATREDAVVGAPLAGAPFADRWFVPALPVSWPPAGPGRYAASVARVLRRLQPRRIEVHNRPEIAIRLARRFPAVPLALFLHNDAQAMRGAGSAAARQRLVLRMQIVCVSAYLRARFLDGLRPEADSAVLPNCIDLARLPPPLEARDPVILFAGRMVADKGADAFVSACAEILPRLPGWRAEMIGADRFSVTGPETPFLAALRPVAASAGIVMHGHLPHPAVLQAMARAAIVVVPSRWQEPFGMTALEAMASGAALIVSPRPGLIEVAGDAALSADPDRPGALPAALLRLAGDPALRQLLSVQGRARAARFDVHAARIRLAALRARPASCLNQAEPPLRSP